MMKKFFNAAAAILLSLNLDAQALPEQLIKITRIETDTVLAECPDIKALKKNEIFSIYRNLEIIDGKEILSGYVDSLYFYENNNNTPVFRYIWDGQKKLLKEGYYLSPTGSFYEKPELNARTGAGTSEVKLLVFAGGGSSAMLFSSLETDIIIEEEGSDSSIFVEANLLFLYKALGLRISATSPQYYEYSSIELAAEYHFNIKTFNIHSYAGLGFVPVRAQFESLYKIQNNTFFCAGIIVPFSSLYLGINSKWENLVLKNETSEIIMPRQSAAVYLGMKLF
jgi:hypothetical protein